MGPITASAIVATVADPRQFRSGRQFAAWLGLVPQQYSSGGKERLGGISKRGDGYIRRLLVHGARAIVGWRKRSSTGTTPWIERCSNDVL
jgi:transposase